MIMASESPKRSENICSNSPMKPKIVTTEEKSIKRLKELPLVFNQPFYILINNIYCGIVLCMGDRAFVDINRVGLGMNIA